MDGICYLVIFMLFLILYTLRVYFIRFPWDKDKTNDKDGK